MSRGETSGYVQTTPSVSGTAQGGWTLDTERLKKSSEGWICAELVFSLAGAGTLTFYRLPFQGGYTPSSNVLVSGFYYDASATLSYAILCTIATNETMSITGVGGFVGVLTPAAGDYIFIPNVFYWNG